MELLLINVENFINIFPKFTQMSRHTYLAAVAFLAVICIVNAQRRLALPDPRSCANST